MNHRSAPRTFPTAPTNQHHMNTSDRHLRFGWWSLSAFLALGLLLETLHGFKVGWYLDVSHEARRLMFTLAHSHGTLLALVNIAAGLTLRTGVGSAARELGRIKNQPQAKKV